MKAWLPGTAAILLASGTAQAQPACGELPPIRMQRFEEDYSSLADPACRTTPLARLKYIPVGGDGAYLTLGSEVRTRVELARHPEFGLETDSDRAILQRFLVHADLHVGTDVRAFVQLGSFFADRRTGLAGTDESRLDLTQGFVDVTLRPGGTELTLRAGRQEVALGSSRLVSVRESPNIRRSYDGGRAMWQGRRLQLQAFWLRPIDTERGVFDDSTDGSEQIYGLYGTAPLDPEARTGLDLYWISYRRDRARFAAGIGAEERHSIGLRFFGEQGGIDWDIEPILQLGSFAGGRVRAWTVATDLGYRPPGLPMEPRIGLKADIASGDGDLGDAVLRTFNALYPRLPYFTEAGLAVPSNIMDLHPSLTFTPARGLEVQFGVNLLWRHRIADAVYVPPPPATPLAGSAGGARYIGAQWEANAEWTPRRGVELKAFFVHFTPGAAVTGIGGRSSDFFAGSIAVKF